MGSKSRHTFLVGLILVSFGLFSSAYAAGSPSTITLDSVTTDYSNGSADGTFENGWKWEFHFTVPTGETQFKMKFSDFTHGSDSVPASAVRIFSAQSDHDSERNAVTGASNDAMNLTGDFDSETSGRQIVAVVEVAVPSGTPGGSYSATYDVESKDVISPVITLNASVPATLCVGGTYVEAGATATDNVDGTDMVTIGGDMVTTTVPTSFHVTYDAVDAAGNRATQAVRTVTVNVFPFPGCPFVLPAPPSQN